MLQHAESMLRDAVEANLIRDLEVAHMCVCMYIYIYI